MIDTLILEGGGINCIATGGALRYLNEQGILKDIKKYAGSSAGSILCALLVIGYNPEEIVNTLFKQNNKIIKNFIDNLLIPYNLFKYFGLYNGKKFVKYICKLFIEKGYSENTTFLELFNKTGKTLTITGTSFSIQDTIFFNHYTYPNFRVIDAIRISMSIPLYFTSVSYNLDGKLHVFGDGGILVNFPYYYYIICESEGKYKSTFQELVPEQEKFYAYKAANKIFLSVEYISDDGDSNDHSNMIGIMLMKKDYKKSFYKTYNGFNSITKLTYYINIFIETMLSKISQECFTNPLTGNQNNFFDRTIVIELPKTVSPINFNIDKETKELFIKAGYDEAKAYFSKTL
jgi:hypothetical protein